MRLLTWTSFTRRGELVNLGWGLAVVPRLMDPPKRPVPKKKPKREQKQDDMRTQVQGYRRGAEEHLGVLWRACKAESERQSHSVALLCHRFLPWNRRKHTCLLESDREVRDHGWRWGVCECVHARSEMLKSPPLTPPTVGPALLF